MSMRERLTTSPKTRVILGDLLTHSLAVAGLSFARAAEALRSAPSAVSQWASGEREVPAEALLYAVRRLSPVEQALVIEMAAAELLGLRIRVELPPDALPDQSPAALVAEVAERSALSIRSILAAVADGRIDQDEAARLRVDATELRRLADRIDALADQAGREGRP